MADPKERTDTERLDWLERLLLKGAHLYEPSVGSAGLWGIGQDTKPIYTDGEDLREVIDKTMDSNDAD